MAIASILFPSRTLDGSTGYSIKMHGKSVLAGYARLWGPIIAFVAFGGAMAGHTSLLLVSTLAIALTALSWTWRNVCRDLHLPPVSFHALRHTHASALIKAGIDLVQISKRLGHSNPTVTLRIYAHLFDPADEAAAVAIDAVMR